MKDQRFFIAVKGIDDDLISEAAEYKPEKISGKDTDESVGVRFSSAAGKRRVRIWKYPVAAAALLGVMGGALFVINDNGVISDNLGGTTKEETVGTAVETSESGADTAETDTVLDEMQGTVSEEIAPIVPIMEVHAVDNDPDFCFPTGLYVASYPKVPQPDFGEEYFTEMSTKELLGYYGFYNNIEYWIDSNQIIEISDENTHHGIYNLPDGSIYDINTFTFEITEKTKYAYAARKFTVTMGKKSKFGQEYIDYYESKGIFAGPKYSAFYNEEMDTLFTVFDNFGVTLMFSATPEEITDNYFADDPEAREFYEKYHDNPYLPGYFEMFITLVVGSISIREDGTHYFDYDTGLWYSEGDDSYLNEDTFEWIPADQWDFD